MFQHCTVWKWSNWLLMQYQYLDWNTLAVFLISKHMLFSCSQGKEFVRRVAPCLAHTFYTGLLYLSVWVPCVFKELVSLHVFTTCFEWAEISAVMRPSGIITRGSLNYVLGHLEWGELRKLHLCKWAWGCVCVPCVAFRSTPLVWFNNGNDVDLNTKCAWHQILGKGRACSSSAVQYR